MSDENIRIVSDDDFAFAVDAHRERTDGTPGLLPRDYATHPLGSLPYASTPFTEVAPIIPENEWPARIKAMQGHFARNLYSGTPHEDSQNGLNYCWAYSLVQAIKNARDIEGQPHLDLAAVSLGGAVNFRNAGNYCGAAIQYAAEHGVCNRSFVAGQWDLKPTGWKKEWQSDALNHRPLEWLELGHVNMRQETVTALLLGFPVYVGLNWLGHAMCFTEVQWVKNNIAIFTPNTWDTGQEMLLTGSKAVPDEAFCLRVSTWSKT